MNSLTSFSGGPKGGHLKGGHLTIGSGCDISQDALSKANPLGR